jgi:thioredoxin 1
MYTSVMILAASLTAGQTATMATDYWHAEEQAKKEKLPLAIFFGSGKDGFQQVSRDGKLTPAMHKLLSEKFLPVYLDLEYEEAKGLAKAFDIKRGKGLVISDRTCKKQVFRHDGDLSGDDLARHLERLAGTDPMVPVVAAPSGSGNGGAAATTGKYVRVTESTFKAEVLETKQPVLIDFYADWCGPCRSMEPTIAGLAADFAGRAKVVKINVDNSRNLASQYGITAIPAFVIIQNGQVVDRVVGASSKADLAAKINARLQGK